MLNKTLLGAMLSGALVLSYAGAAYAQARIYFIAPKDGVTVTSPVHVKFGVDGMSVAPAGTMTEGTGHHHLLIDGKPVPKGTVIPANDTTLHYGKAQTEADVKLPPGGPHAHDAVRRRRALLVRAGHEHDDQGARPVTPFPDAREGRRGVIPGGFLACAFFMKSGDGAGTAPRPFGQCRGTVLLVSHDRAFLDNVVTSVFAAEGGGKWREYVGGFSDWQIQRERSERIAEEAARQTAKETPKDETPEDSAAHREAFVQGAARTGGVAWANRRAGRGAEGHRRAAPRRFHLRPRREGRRTSFRAARGDRRGIVALERWEELEAKRR